MQGIANDQTQLAIGNEKTKNVKTGAVAVTYASQQSCPRSCPLYGNGCYAESGPLGMISRRLNKAATEQAATPVNIATAEAAIIRGMSGKKPLRLHVVGDCRTEEATRIVSQAAAEYRAKGGQAVWSYTHAWRLVPRVAWGDVSILASCETLTAVKKAQARGYATAMVVDHHPEDGRATVVDGQKLIPCPQQTRPGVTCASCRLCFDDQKLLERKATITFAIHGSQKKAAKAAIEASASGA
jgi:hypothetical protein